MSDEKIRPIDLRRTAKAIASNYGDKGAIVISMSPEGVRVGADGLTSDEARYALCVAINYSFQFENYEETK